MQRGVPSVVAVTERFLGLAQAVAQTRGVPDLPLVTLPAEIEELSETDLDRRASGYLADLIDALQPR